MGWDGVGDVGRGGNAESGLSAGGVGGAGGIELDGRNWGSGDVMDIRSMDETLSLVSPSAVLFARCYRLLVSTIS